jgi:hypothetical protein
MVSVQRPVSPRHVQTNQSGGSLLRNANHQRHARGSSLPWRSFNLRSTPTQSRESSWEPRDCPHTSQHSIHHPAQQTNKLTCRPGPGRLPSDAGCQGLVYPPSLYLFRLLCFSALSPLSPLSLSLSLSSSPPRFFFLDHSPFIQSLRPLLSCPNFLSFFT